jgi:MFS family permease
MLSTNRRHMLPQAAIFMTVLLDILSFSLQFPDIQLRGDLLVSQVLGSGAPALLSGFLVGLGSSIFSIFQFALGPVLGRWSDFVGRRKVLLVTTVLATVSAALYGFADHYYLLLLARALQGIAGANLGVAYAYVSDTSEPENRAKAMGSLGAAFGIGFVIGPPLGALLIEAGGGKPMLMGLTAAALSLVNLIFVWQFLPESLKPENVATEKVHRFEIMKTAFKTPTLGLLLSLFFVANFAFSNLEGTFFLFADQHFHMTRFQGAIILTVVGVTGVIVQGFVVPRLVPKFGEVNLVRTSYILQSPAMAILPWAPPWIPMILACIVLSGASGLGQPNLSSLISRITPANMAGGIFGVTQSLGAIARIFGPLVAIPMLKLAYWLPYTFAGVLLLVPLFGMLKFRQPDPAAVS